MRECSLCYLVPSVLVATDRDGQEHKICLKCLVLDVLGAGKVTKVRLIGCKDLVDVDQLRNTLKEAEGL